MFGFTRRLFSDMELLEILLIKVQKTGESIDIQIYSDFYSVGMNRSTKQRMPLNLNYPEISFSHV